MKVKREIEVTVCDVPGCTSEEDCYSICLACGAAHCFNHSYDWQPQRPHPERVPHGVRYEGNVWGGAVRDGYYCTPCDERLSRERTDGLHAAYQSIAVLRAQFVARRERDELHVARVEAELQKEREKRGLR